MARTAPVTTPPREFSNEDMAMRALPPIEDEREPEVIVASEQELAAKDYLDELAFMEEPVTIRLHRGSEKHAPRFEQFGVNGRVIWIETDKPTTIPRKYVEVMARSQPMDITTRSGEAQGDELTFNVVDRNNRRNFSFSVLNDPSPKGQAWLTKVMRES